VSNANAADGEDVLLSEGRIVSDLVEPWQPPRHSVSAGFDPRTAIFRAREAHRERERAKAAAVRLATGAEAAAAAPMALKTTSARLAAEPAGADFSTRIAEVIRSERGERREEIEPEYGQEDAWPIYEPDASDDFQFGLANGSTEASASSGEAIGPSAAQFPGESEYDQPRPLETEICVPMPDEYTTGQQPVEERRFADSSAAGGEGLPAWFQVDLPRICRACRDFRPSADGLRGSCGNTWAFTHRRLVQADDAAPCRSAIGDWWAPVDDVWLVAADVSAHGRPTPLLDRLLGQPATKRRQS
jgi:hypothetical protein